MFTLGEAAKQVGKSKTALSKAIKTGRMSANKNGNSYSIDPAELFRVYPRVTVNQEDGLTMVDPKVNPIGRGEPNESTGVNQGSQALLDEKDKRIADLNRDKEKLEELLDSANDQAKRVTLLLENKGSSGSGWEKAAKALESRISNQETAVKEEKAALAKITRENKILRKKLLEERNKGFWSKLFG